MHSAGPSTYWYVTRGAGVVTLMLLTLSVAIGVAHVRRFRTERIPRFAIEALHRSVSLLALVFLAIHIVTSLLDTFAPIRVIDVIVPFVSSYRPLWLGLGTIASELVVAVTLTSVLRVRLGYRAWRATHWLAYLCWPVALVHGLGTGSDTKVAWMLVLTVACVLTVVAAVVVRATAGWPDHVGVRGSAVAASIAGPIALLIWLPIGPLAHGWARRAGTPAALLGSPSAATASAGPGASPPAAPALAPRAFSAQASGTVTQSQVSAALVRIDLSLALGGQSLNRLAIRIDGRPVPGGGVQMISSDVTLGTGSNPAMYRGRVTGLVGSNIQASLAGAKGSLGLLAQLQIDPNAGTATGTVDAKPKGRAGRSP